MTAGFRDVSNAAMAPRTAARKPPARTAPKGRPIAADNPNTEQLMVRVGAELLADLDAWIERLNAAGTGPRWTRSDVVRAALQRAVKDRGEKGETP